MDSRLNVGVLFGGRSVEHEISIITALEVIGALDIERFHAVPIYIDAYGSWYTGDALLEKEFYRDLPASLRSVTEVMFVPMPGIGGLTPRSKKARGAHSWFGAANAEVVEVDVFFPAFHGQFGEDGCIQGLCELADVPYTGCDVMASAIAMDKSKCKHLLRAHSIPVLPWRVVEKEQSKGSLSDLRGTILSTPGLQYPFFVKPCHLGSSIGISRATDNQTLDAALLNVFRYDSQAIVEPCITELLEINVSVLEGEPPRTSVVEVPQSESGTLTYEEKYMRGGGKKGAKQASQGMASLARRINPHDLDPRLRDAATHYALKAFDAIGCAGVVRFDFIVNKTTGEIFFNELNPIPGSLAYYLWENSEPPLLYTDMLSIMIDGAVNRKEQQSLLERDIGFKALY